MKTFKTESKCKEKYGKPNITKLEHSQHGSDFREVQVMGLGDQAQIPTLPWKLSG